VGLLKLPPHRPRLTEPFPFGQAKSKSPFYRQRDKAYSRLASACYRPDLSVFRLTLGDVKMLMI
jgi:hypothetical protein